MLRIGGMLSREEVASMNVQELSDAKTLKQDLNRKHGLPRDSGKDCFISAIL